IDEFSLDCEKAVKDVDLVILAVPVNLIVSYVKKIAPYLKKNCLIIDVGSTKDKIVKEIKNFISSFSSSFHFIPCHPLVGSEKAKILAANSSLFQNSICIITPIEGVSKNALNKVKKMWQILGAKIVLCTPSFHDKILSLTSHLPHLIAFSLVNCFNSQYKKNSVMKKFIGKGFLDTTRIGASNPYIWKAIFLSNQKEIIKSLKKFIQELKDFEKLIENKNEKALLEKITKASICRQKLKNEK
ncbi:MAG: prephenate dehydrogenase, partial [bacterium]